MPLPSTLNASLLKDILRYARNQRRKIETDLEQKCKGEWTPCGRDVSDDEFYVQLHNFLQSRQRRTQFNSIADEHSNRKRKLALHTSIFTYYQRKCPSVATIKRGSLSVEDFHLQIVEEFASHDDMECVANVVWTFVDGGNAFDIFKKFFATRPDLKEEIQTLEKGRDTPTLNGELESALEVLTDVVQNIQSFGLDTAKANLLLSTATKIQELAHFKHHEYAQRLDTVISDHSDVLSSSSALEAANTSLRALVGVAPITQNWERLLECIDKSLFEFTTEEVQRMDLLKKLQHASLEETSSISKNIASTASRQEKIRSGLESFLKVLTGSGAEAHKTSDDPDSTEDSDSAECSFAIPVKEQYGSENVAQIEMEKDSEPIQSDSGNTTEISATTHENTSTSEKQQHSRTPLEKSVLNSLLTRGEFALAYWVAKKSNVFDATVLGVVAEGALVEPGAGYSGRLTNFIEELSAQNERTDDENLLLVAAIIQPLLFLKTYPHSLYQVAATLPDTPLTPIIERLRPTCISQEITLDRADIFPNSEEVGHEKESARLSREAHELIERIELTNFNYQAAEQAFRRLFAKNSPWMEMLNIVSGQQSDKLELARRLSEKLNPQKQMSSIQSALPKSKKKIEGPQKEKLLRFLHKSIEITNNWINLTDATISNSERLLEQKKGLKSVAVEEIEHALHTLNEIKQRSPVQDAAIVRLNQLRSILLGMTPTVTGVDQVCISLPDIRLDDDMTPEGANKKNLLASVKKYVREKYDLYALFEECMANDEFVRAERLIEVKKMGSRASQNYSQRLLDRHTELIREFEALQDRVEEAFLLGQTWNSKSNEENFRTDLLSLIETGSINLENRESLSLNRKVREAGRVARQITERIDQIEENRKEKLSTEKTRILSQFQSTEQGESDKEYFNLSFDQCMNQLDYVGAFDLLDRAQGSINTGEPIARTASTELSRHTTEFIKFIDNADVNKFFRVSSWRKRSLENIESGDTVFGIHFDHFDKARRIEAVSILEKWNALDKLENIEEICKFLEFPVISSQDNQRAMTPQGGFIHHTIQLTSVAPKSPIPYFGSGLQSQLDVVVVLARKEPLQVSEYLRQIQITHSKGILVLFGHVLSKRYRVEWLKECVRNQLTMLPLDGALILFLCGERDRLAALLSVGLSTTWAQPYIEGGETVAKEMFVGRSKEASDLIDSNGSCIVFGGRQLGKSALLTHVEREFHNPQGPKGMHVAYIDVNTLGEPQTKEEMATEFWRRVADQFALPISVRSAGKSRKYLNLTEQVPVLIESYLQNIAKNRLILLLDETDKLLDLDSHSDFNLVRELRSLMAKTGRRFKVILAGLQSVQRYHNWKNHPFAQLGNEIVVDPLQPRAAEDLIRRPFRALGFQFENSALIRRIVSISNYHPGLIQIFCYRLLSNLYKKNSQWKTLTRFVTESDVLAIERNASFKLEVRNRFDWTLGLDDRYKVLTYGLVFSDRPTEAKSLYEFKALGVDWWPQVFETMDAQDMRALLDELVGLGVLLAEPDEDTHTLQYRLRSPNLLRLLGTEEAIEHDLVKITELDRLNRPNPQNFRTPISDSACYGPLTHSQTGQLSNTDDNFSTTVVMGSAAMGGRSVADQIRYLFASKGTNANQIWKEIQIPTTGGALNPDRMSDWLLKQFARRKREHLYAIFDFDEIAFGGDLGDLFEKTTDILKKKCRSNSRGKLFVVLNPEKTLEWVSSIRRQALENRQDFYVTTLRRWTEGGIANALDRINLQTGSKSASAKILKMTSGIHCLVSEALNIANDQNGMSAQVAVDTAEHVKKKFQIANQHDLLSDLGVPIDNIATKNLLLELFQLSDSEGGERLVFKSDFEHTVGQFFDSKINNTQSIEPTSCIRNWFEALNLIWTSGKDEQRLNICPLTLELISQLHN